jgi:hypothetical protein
MLPDRVLRASLGMAVIATVGCGGGQPLLHAAHAVPTGTVTVGAGTSGHFIVGDAQDSIEEARSASRQAGGNQRARDDLVRRGAVAFSALAPGVAPWIGVRAGIAKDIDGGLTYTGRSARLDARHSFPLGSYAVSVGGGITGVLLRPGSDPPSTDANGVEVTSDSGNISGVDLGAVTGFGVDVPVLFGWRSDADLVRLWIGVRGGYERLHGEVLIAERVSGMPEESGTTEIGRVHAGGLVGMAVGLGPIWAAAELDAGYQSVRGSLDLGTVTADATLAGVSITPAAALFTKF